MLFNQKQIYGITTELIVAQKFIEKGYIVSIPYGNNSRYDMIVDTDKDCYRIQVKHASINDNGSYTVNTSNTVSTAAGNSRKYYTKDDVDFIVTVIEGKLTVENHNLYLGESFIILSDTKITDIFGEGIVLITEVK